MDVNYANALGAMGFLGHSAETLCVDANWRKIIQIVKFFRSNPSAPLIWHDVTFGVFTLVSRQTVEL